ncbi:MAG: hypothetical protein DMD33_02970 [Gemmatimonadetes bacterium]|nr:MAG: hypothetical protein DMD33_02970 [Gemmatimonadota bacterium]
MLVPAPVPVPWAISHAALPIVEHLDPDRIRVYFTGRDERSRGHIGTVDVDLSDAKEALTPAVEPVLRPGPLGAFDDNGVTSSCLVRDNATRYLYYSGWSLGVTVPFYFYAGCAVSEAGGAFERISAAPILERNDVDPYLTASPWVLHEGDTWRMWYVSGVGWSEGADPRPRYHVKYAESHDGVSWSRDGQVCLDFQHPGEYAIGRPCVRREGDRYRMWYCYRGDAYRLGYAESPDGVTWTRKDDEIQLSGPSADFDAEMQAYPVVEELRGEPHLLYNGDRYGATGIGWAVAEAD